jgi:hypothetical protein
MVAGLIYLAILGRVRKILPEKKISIFATSKSNHPVTINTNWIVPK